MRRRTFVRLPAAIRREPANDRTELNMSDSGEGEGQTQWSFDWSQFPALTKVMQSNGDADTHLAWLGVDVNALNQTA
ncbi:MAG: hypothetical protein QOD72_1900 [Acidimicrobiaceae bacterium]|jgi:hypothetical protein|nr:hypothetical protein [Acidimicrobiaceae bacterium]